MRTTWKGHKVKYEVITGDWMGNPDVPRGVYRFDPYIEEIEVTAPDGDDMTDDLTEETIDEIKAMCLEEWSDNTDPDEAYEKYREEAIWNS